MSVTHDYIIAAYVWPAYHDAPRWRDFFRGREGEWEIIRKARPKFEGHWQPRVPLWGYEQESDPVVMEKKIDVALSHGVNCFIYDWYWYDNQPFLEEALNQGFLGARNHEKMKFYLMWANHDATTLWDIERSHEHQVIWPGDVDRPTFEIVVRRVLRQYMKHPSYLTIEGEPVFSIYELGTFMKGLGGVDPTRDALNWFRREAQREGLPGVHIQGILWGNVPRLDESGALNPSGSQDRTVLALGVDSLTHYQYVHIVSPMNEYVAWCDKATEAWSRWDQEFSVPYFPHVSIGWDTNPRFKDFKPCVKEGATPNHFKIYLRKAKAYVDAHPEQTKLITINSWNEWGEGSYLEPDDRFGFGYLEAVRDVFKEGPVLVP